MMQGVVRSDKEGPAPRHGPTSTVPEGRGSAASGAIGAALSRSRAPVSRATG
jgi:hypothetical protein